MDYFVYAVAVLLLGSVALFVKHAVFDHRPQKIGLIYAVLAVPLYVIYYSDRSPLNIDGVRSSLKILGRTADPHFTSEWEPALLVLVLLLVHLIVVQRVAVRERLVKLQNPIATFLASAMFASVTGGILVTAYHWGWTGALIVAGVYILVYIGVLAVLASIMEIVIELLKLFGVWLKRQLFKIATAITRVASFLASLAGRLGLTDLAARIRRDKEAQETIFHAEQETQDRQLEEAYERDRAAQMQSSGKAPTDPAPTAD